MQTTFPEELELKGFKITTMSLPCTVSEILLLVSQNLKRSRDHEHPIREEVIYHACTSTPQYESAQKFKVSSFTNSKDMIDTKFDNSGFSHSTDVFAVLKLP